MLSALSAFKFGMIYTVHIVLISITFVYSWKVKPNRVSIPVLQDIWGPNWSNKSKQMLSLVLAVSSLYYFPENSGCDLSTDLIYYAVMNFITNYNIKFCIKIIHKKLYHLYVLCLLLDRVCGGLHGCLHSSYRL